MAVDRAATGLGAAVGRGLSRKAALTGVAGGAGAVLWHLVVVWPLWALSLLTGYRPLAEGSAIADSAFVPVDRRRDPTGRPARASQRRGAEPAMPAGIRWRARLRWAIPLAAAALVVGLGPWGAGRSDDGLQVVDLRGALQPAHPSGESVAMTRVDTSGFKRDGTTRDGLSFAGYPVTRYSHEHEPWAPWLYRELSAGGYTYDLMLGNRLAEYRSRFVNIHDGARASYTPKHPTLTVWFFGGSTMYGIGQRDDHTIASEVARLARRDGVSIRAVNFGASGDVNWQEVERFSQELSAARQPWPDLVVFYDGINEWGVGGRRVAVGSTDPDVIDRLPIGRDEELMWRIALGGRDRRPHPGLEVSLAATQYRRGVEVARRLGEAAGVDVVTAFQPLPWAKRLSPADEKLLQMTGRSPAESRSLRRTYEQILAASATGSVDLIAALDDVDQPVSSDGVHTNELGARVIAEALYRELRPRLLASARAAG